MKKSIILIIILLICNILMYLPVIYSEDPITVGYMEGFQFTFSILSAIIIIVCVFYNLSWKQALLLSVISVLLLASPGVINEGWDRWEEYQYRSQPITSEYLYDKYFKNHNNFIPKMSRVKVDVDNEHVFLEMEYGSSLEKKDVSEAYLKRRLLTLLSSKTRILSMYNQLKLVTIHVQFYDKTYVFQNIPLEDEKGKSFYDSDDYKAARRILEENLEIVS